MFVQKLLLLLSIQTVAAKVENWSYGARGNDWKGTCSTGSRQSPINIPFTQPAELLILKDEHLKTQFEFGETGSLTVENDGHSLNFYFDEDDEISNTMQLPIVGGLLHGILEDTDRSAANTDYATAFQYSFQLRTPSEHTYNGFVAPVEGQMVMLILQEFLPSCEQEACIVIVNFRFNYDIRNSVESPFLADILSQIEGEWPEQGEIKYGMNGTADNFNGTVDFSMLLNGEENPSYALYTGSATMPPCDENVLWYIMEQPLPISVQQVEQLEDLFAPDEDGVLRNSRLVQPLNGRKIAHINSQKLYQEM
eukprot:TRINITY_DN2917_c1_g1_i3.p1 TRINITY_DN2917_c1_g1~~TRINITY_DN2917_c1_g1_i3.p1  ORF type:complete len:343 (-),score=45.28 TRINITY_DN2917_c1_g1_i3:195-1121(-)